MDKEKFLETIKEIGTCDDEATRRTLLAEISDEVSLIYDANETLSQDKEKYLADNEKLREANMKLFLRVGDSKDANTVQKDTTGIQEPEVNIKKFEDLFDEKGGIL